jgi:hypothetical protein
MKRTRPRAQPSDHPVNSLDANGLVERNRARLRAGREVLHDLLRGDGDAEPPVVTVREKRPWRKFVHADGSTSLSKKMQAMIHLAAFGSFDAVTAPMSLESAARICHLQLRAVRRLQQSDLFMNALKLAQAEAEALRRDRFTPTAALEILLVTTRRSRRWIIPKGWPIKGTEAAKTGGA